MWLPKADRLPDCASLTSRPALLSNFVLTPRTSHPWNRPIMNVSFRDREHKEKEMLRNRDYGHTRSVICATVRSAWPTFKGSLYPNRYGIEIEEPLKTLQDGVQSFMPDADRFQTDVAGEIKRVRYCASNAPPLSSLPPLTLSMCGAARRIT